MGTKETLKESSFFETIRGTRVFKDWNTGKVSNVEEPKQVKDPKKDSK